MKLARACKTPVERWRKLTVHGPFSRDSDRVRGSINFRVAFDDGARSRMDPDKSGRCSSRFRPRDTLEVGRGGVIKSCKSISLE